MKQVLMIVVLIVPLFGEQPKCKGNPKIIAACYTVHGRATFGPGTPALRIWPVGTKRMLGVTAGPIADDADDPIVRKISSFLMMLSLFTAISKSVLSHPSEKASCEWSVLNQRPT
jgi:hypothetical protein